eukprot:g17669.t1
MDWALLHERWQLSEQALQSLCFSAAYVVVLLHHGLGFDKKSQQISFVPQGNLSWAKGAIIWEVNHRFSSLQPLCATSEYFLCHWCGGPASAHEDKGPASEEELRENRQIVMPKKLQAIPYCHPAAKANRQERDELLKTLRLQYAELRPWADAFDLVALQEVDQALRTHDSFRQAHIARLLAPPHIAPVSPNVRSAPHGGAHLSSPRPGLGPDRWVESAPHVDARGIPVDSTTAVLLGPASRWRIRGKAHCERVARRDHCGILLEGTFPLVLCSVHLHPPSGTAAYLQYLEPLKEMMLSLVPEQPGHSPALALLGDWNCSQGQLKELMAEDRRPKSVGQWTGRTT